VYDTSEKRRSPSWCDRIIWLGDDIRGIEYGSRMDFCMSDHKPVYAVLSVPIRVIDREKMAKVEEEIRKRLDAFEKAATPDLRIVGEMMHDFGNVGLCDKSECRFRISNHGIVAAKWGWIAKNELGICKDWIVVGAKNGIVPAGESADVIVKIDINGRAAADFNFKRDPLEDILVLHGSQNYFNVELNSRRVKRLLSIYPRVLEVQLLWKPSRCPMHAR
jgi:phosphatidylinositol-bisphosphatase